MEDNATQRNLTNPNNPNKPNKEKTMEEEREPRYTRINIEECMVFIPDDNEHLTYQVSSMEKIDIVEELNVVETVQITTEDLWELVGIIKKRKNNPEDKIKKGGQPNDQ